MLQALTLTVIYLSAIVVQLRVPFNVLSPVELLFGVGIMLKSATIQPQPKDWQMRIIKLLGVVLVFILFIILFQRNPDPIVQLSNNGLSIVTFVLLLLIFQMSGGMVRLETKNQWQDSLARATLFTALGLMFSGFFYNPYSQRLIIPLAGIIGHMILGIVYFFCFQAMEKYSDQLVLELDEEEWLYRKADSNS